MPSCFFFILCLITLLMNVFPHAAHAAVSNVPAVWRPVGVGGGGAFFSPSLSPNGPDLFVSSDMSGVYHSADLGVTWSVVDFRQIQGGRAALVAFTSDPQILYALDQSNDSGTPAQSTDGGRTWTRLAADPTGSGAFSLLADPNRTDRLIVSDYSNLYFSGDGGAHFAQIYSFPNGGNGLFIAGAFFDGQNITIGTSAGLLRSTNGGGSFALAPPSGLPSTDEILSFAGARQGATTRFLILTVPKGSVYPGITVEDFFWSDQARVYSIDWGAGNWTQRTAGLATDARPVFVGMAANNISTAWLAGGTYNNDWPSIERTTDGGAHWQDALLTSNNQNVITGWMGDHGDRNYGYGGGIVGFAVAPNDANRAAFTDYGYMHLTTDGATWRQVYLNPADQHPAGVATPVNRSYHSNGLEDTSCWNVTWADANNVWASFTDIRGIRSTDGGNAWSFDYTGHTENTAYQCIRHPQTGALYMATSTVHDLYESTYLADSRIDGGRGRILFSTDKGKTWQVLHDFGHPVVDLTLDPNNANTLYASVVHSSQGGIYKSANIHLGAAATWSQLPAPPRTMGHPLSIRALKDGALACSYSGRRNSSGAFTDTSGVFILNPGDGAWTDRSDANMHYWVRDLVIDPHDTAQNTWYGCVYGGWGGPWDTNNDAGGLYKTTDRGRHWTRLIKLQRVGSCTVNPADPDELYLATETEGLWHTANLRAATPAFTQVAGYPFRHPARIAWNPYKTGEVWVTSFGNGIRVGSPATAAGEAWRMY